MLPLDREETLEVFEIDVGFVRVESVHEEVSFQVYTLLRVNIERQLVVLGSVGQIKELLLPLPADLGTGAVLAANLERLGVSGALLGLFLDFGAFVFELVNVLLHNVVLLGLGLS